MVGADRAVEDGELPFLSQLGHGHQTAIRPAAPAGADRGEKDKKLWTS